jgi:hypothetical protein
MPSSAGFPVICLHSRSKGEGEAHRAVLDITCGRSAIEEASGVGVVEAGGDITRIAILDNLGICAPGLAEVHSSELGQLRNGDAAKLPLPIPPAGGIIENATVQDL